MLWMERKVLVIMVLQGCLPFPNAHIGAQFSKHIFVLKLVSITFFLRPEEALLVLTS